jgi:hypothetical protein
VKIRVADCVCPLTKDIDLDARFNAPESDKLVNRCIDAVTNALKSPAPRFSDFQRSQMIQIFLSMRHAHRAVREMLRSDGKDPIAVNVMPLVRTQLEMLYAICLIVEKPDALALYLKDGWKKLYIQYLLKREESLALPRFQEGLRGLSTHLELFRLASGVTENEKRTIEEEELGITDESDFQREHIVDFPTPHKVMKRIENADRKKMLERLYPEYQFLCGFVHFSPAPMILSTVLDDRHALAWLSTPEKRTEIFQKEIASPAIALDLIGAVQSCCEVVAVYPGDVELAKATSEAWRPIADGWFLGQIVWKLRTQKLLGILG